jgi:hypothetical protein
MKVRHFYPLLGFAVPSLIIGYGFVIPRSCFAGAQPRQSWFRLHHSWSLHGLLEEAAARDRTANL